MKNTPGRLPSSAGGLYSFGPFFSRNFGYGSMTTSAFGSRPNHCGTAAFARASAACEYAINSSRLLNRYLRSVRTRCSSFGTSPVWNERSRDRLHLAQSIASICCSPVACTSLAGIGSEL